MTLRGHIRNGAVVLDEPAHLADGTAVEVRAVPETTPASTEDPGPTWAEVFRDVAGTVDGLPTDLADNHDHYIRGAAKGIDRR
jgi:hypothetical protein